MSKQFKKGELVTYRLRKSHKVQAIVRRAHRNGECTVEARHLLNLSGERVGGYLGYRYRMSAADLCPA